MEKQLHLENNNAPIWHVAMVTWILVVINIAIFLRFWVDGASESILNTYALTPSNFYWQNIFTSIFLHISVWQLVGNTLFLLIFGDTVEEQLTSFGFAIFYIISGAAGVLIHYFLCYDQIVLKIPVVGSTSAISGVIGAYLVLFPKIAIRWNGNNNILSHLRISPIFFLMFWCAFITYLVSPWDSPKNSEISPIYWPHIGGGLFGVIFALIWSKYFSNLSQKSAVKEDTVKTTDLHAGKTKLLNNGKDTDLFTLYKLKIEELIKSNKIDDALELYHEMEKHVLSGALKKEHQILIAKELLTRKEFSLAFLAYSRFIYTYPDETFASEARGWIGLLLNRCFFNISEAWTYLNQALNKTNDITDESLLKEITKDWTKIKSKFFDEELINSNNSS